MHVDLLLTFLEPFNEYDREEVCEQCFGHIDPRDAVQCRRMLDDAYFCDAWYSRTSVDVKVQLATVLIHALADPEFDFRWLVEDARGTFGLPRAWGQLDYRALYENVYHAMRTHWGRELQAAGVQLDL